MAYIHPAFEAYRRNRLMRPDAERWAHPDCKRYQWAVTCNKDTERKYDPSQPRDAEGRWADGGAQDFQHINDPRVISDESPDVVQAGD